MANALVYDPEVQLVWDKPYNTGYASKLHNAERLHKTRESVTWALEQLDTGNPDTRSDALDAIRKVLSLQDTDPISRTYGIWSWYYEEPLNEMGSNDFNWADFIGEGLLTILHRHGDDLPPELVASMDRALRHAGLSIFRRNVGSYYTNICTLGAAVTGGIGERFGWDWMVDYAAKRLARQADDAETGGCVPEYNSPVYYPVTIGALEFALTYCRHPELVAAARRFHRWMWVQIAEAFHPGTGQWSGPQARTYSESFGDDRRRWFGLRGITRFADQTRGRPTPEDAVPCPEDLRPRFDALPETPLTQTVQLVVGERASEKLDRWMQRWMNDRRCMTSITLGNTWTQCRHLLGYARGDSGQTVVLRNRITQGGRDFASGCVRQAQHDQDVLTVYGLITGKGNWHGTLDRPADGVFKLERLAFRYELIGADAEAEQTDGHTFLLHADGVGARVVTGPAVIAGQPAEWRSEVRGGCAAVVCEMPLPADLIPSTLPQLGPTYGVAGVHWYDANDSPPSAPAPTATISSNGHLEAAWLDRLGVAAPTIAEPMTHHSPTAHRLPFDR